VPQVRPHRRGEGQVLGGGAWIAGARQRQAETELGVIVAWTRIDYPAKVRGSRSVLACIELGPRQRLQDAPGVRLGCGRALQQLRGGRGAAAAEQVKAPLIELIGVGAVNRSRIPTIL
jgi:hypothetical protein